MKNTRGVPLAADLKRQMQRTAVAAELPEVLLHSARVRRKALIHVPTPLLDGTGAVQFVDLLAVSPLDQIEPGKFRMTRLRLERGRSGGPVGAGGAFGLRLSRAWRMVSHVIMDARAFLRPGADDAVFTILRVASGAASSKVYRLCRAVQFLPQLSVSY